MYLPERSHPIGPVGGITDICCSQSRDTVRSLPGGRSSSEGFNDVNVMLLTVEMRESVHSRYCLCLVICFYNSKRLSFLFQDYIFMHLCTCCNDAHSYFCMVVGILNKEQKTCPLIWSIADVWNTLRKKLVWLSWHIERKWRKQSRFCTFKTKYAN